MNTMVLGVVMVNRASGGVVADETLVAMAARTVFSPLLAPLLPLLLAWERSRRLAA